MTISASWSISPHHGILLPSGQVMIPGSWVRARFYRSLFYSPCLFSLSKKLINIYKNFCKTSRDTLIGLWIQIEPWWLQSARWESTGVVAGDQHSETRCHISWFPLRGLQFGGPSVKRQISQREQKKGSLNHNQALTLTLTPTPKMNLYWKLNLKPNPNH